MSSFSTLYKVNVQGERYAKKVEVIAEWMRKDEMRDRFFETTKAPSGIRCLTCNREMFVSSKHLDIGFRDEEDRIMFIYDCRDNHLPLRIFYDNGEEWEREKPTCAKCKAEVEVVHEDTEETFRTVYTCSSCGHVEVDEFERTVKKEPEVDPEFEKDRKRFCDPEKGLQYVTFRTHLEEFHKLTEKEKEKEEKKDLYDRVEKLKKLSIPQVKDFIEKKLSKTQYKNLTFEKPDMSHIVSVTFTTEDPTDTNEYDSRTKLTKTLKKALEKTNWRLMSDGLSYRLGVLTGRIRVYEKEEEMVKLIEKQK